MNTALYIRVSTDDQLDYSPESQRKLLLDYAKKNNLNVCEEHIFIDEGISGRKADKRPQFQNMIAIARSKEKPFDKILVWKFSRFARNQEESIVYKNMLRKDGIEVVSISEPIIEGPFGSLIERIIEWMDEYYSTRLSSEVHRGMSEKASTQGILASPPYGYRLINNNYIVDQDEAEIIRLMFKRIIEGKGLTAICSELRDMGIKSRRGSGWIPKRVKYCIQNPVYIGKLRWNYTTHGNGRKINDESEWIIVDGTHEPIVSENDFKKANDIVGRNINLSTKRPYKSEIRHYLSGLIRCCDCKGTLIYTVRPRVGKKTTTYQKFYRCNNFSKGACKTSNYIRLEKLETDFHERLKRDLKYLLEQKGNLINISVNIDTDQVALLEKQLEKVRNKYTIAKKAYLAEIDTLEEYKTNKEEIAAEENKILMKIKDMSSNNTNIHSLKQNIEHALDILNNDKLSMQEKNTFLKSFIRSIEINVKNNTLDVFYFR